VDCEMEKRIGAFPVGIESGGEWICCHSWLFFDYMYQFNLARGRVNLVFIDLI